MPHTINITDENGNITQVLSGRGNGGIDFADMLAGHSASSEPVQESSEIRTCHHCNAEGHRRHYARTRQGLVICGDCLRSRNEYRKCGCCSRWSLTEGFEHGVCSDCSPDYAYCGCGALHEKRHMVVFSDRSDPYCSDCANSVRSRFYRINNYSFKPDPIFDHTAEEGQDVTHFGIELEVDGSNARSQTDGLGVIRRRFSPTQAHFYAKSDCSINNGFEIVSHPKSYDAHRRFAWNKVLRELRRRRYKGHNASSRVERDYSCGFHIHIERKGLSVNQQYNIARFVWVCRREIQKLSRRNNAQLVHWANFQRVNYTEDYDEMYRYTTCSSRGALNAQNRHTLELRVFRSTLAENTFWASLQFAKAMTEFCKAIRTDGFENASLVWGMFVAWLRPQQASYAELWNKLEVARLV